MAILYELGEGWEEWLSERPSEIKEMAIQNPPNRLYLLKSSNHRCTIHSYSEDGTVTANITGEYNLIDFSRQVFGINPGDLEECDLPDKDEAVGEILNNEESMELINSQRAKNGLEPLDESELGLLD